MFRLRFLLGDFDPEENPYGKMDRSRLACSDHKEAGGTGGQRVCDSAGKQGAAAPSGRRHRQGCRCGAAFNENYTCWYCGYAPDQTPVVKGLQEKLGQNRVLFDEGFDHVILKSRKTENTSAWGTKASL